MLVRENVGLAQMTTLGVGGPAARLVDLEREQELPAALRDAAARGDDFVVLGGGSNVLVGDGGFAGTVVRVATKGVEARIEGDRAVVWVEAGEDWDGLVARAVHEGWRGIESLSGIPGWVGATPVQNVGAYGQEVSDTILRVRVFDREDARFVELPSADCAFGYRASRFRTSRRYVVTRVCFAFERAAEGFARYAELARALKVEDDGKAPLRTVRETVLSLRRAKGMVVDPGDPDSASAGSFFVNPFVDAAALARVEEAGGGKPPCFAAGEGRWKVAAAWLVERAGFAKGFQLGRAGISTKHALAIVNCGGASAGDVLRVARTVRQGVADRFGILLDLEPFLVGVSWQ